MTTLRWLALTIAVCAAALPAAAADAQSGPLTVEAAWARPSIGEATNSAAYFRIANSGDAPDRLLAVKSDAAGHVMLHESRMEGTVMKMLPLDGGIEVPAHGSAELKPLGAHVMLVGLRAPLKDGDTLPLTLLFEKQGEVAITAKVQMQAPVGDAAPGAHEHH